jgi:hypothetical protein
MIDRLVKSRQKFGFELSGQQSKNKLYIRKSNRIIYEQTAYTLKISCFYGRELTK